MKWGCFVAMSMAFVPMHAGSLASFDARDSIVFPANQAKTLLSQCSRHSPENVTGTWYPTPTQIRELEERLPGPFSSTIKAQESRFHAALSPSQRSNRQYGGVIVGGRRLIYVNVFPHEIVEHAAEVGAMPYWEGNKTWKNTALMVCDGGPSFWGVLYDPDRKIFEDFQFNGYP